MNFELLYQMGLEVALQVRRETGLDGLSFRLTNIPTGIVAHGVMSLNGFGQTYSLPSSLLEQLLQLPEASARLLLKETLEVSAREFEKRVHGQEDEQGRD
jgi:hypothetical protein